VISVILELQELVRPEGNKKLLAREDTEKQLKEIENVNLA
jgi:hypothetical protein